MLHMYALYACIAQLGERQTEDLKVPGSIPGVGIFRCFQGEVSSRFSSFPPSTENNSVFTAFSSGLFPQGRFCIFWGTLKVRSAPNVSFPSIIRNPPAALCARRRNHRKRTVQRYPKKIGSSPPPPTKQWEGLPCHC